MLSYATPHAQFLRAVEGTPQIDHVKKFCARVPAAKSRRNLPLQEILSARSEMHSPKDLNFQKWTSQSCRDFHAVCKNAQILSYVTKRDLKS